MDAAVAAGRRAAIAMAGVVCMLLVAGMLEGVGRQTVQGNAARIGIGSTMLLFWLAYYYLPRRKGAGDALAVPRP